ncbi:MAG: hypothetical protein JWO95_905 [Verrucomicrobiales bacterium]|nr:hypothetical protein [Verrucomicrobiales bacterium]
MDIAACEKLGVTQFVTKSSNNKTLFHCLGTVLACKNANVPCYANCPSAQPLG